MLALQGGFAAHLDALERCGARGHEVRRTAHLEGVEGLVLPGGETTALLKLLAFEPEWWEVLPQLARRGTPILGTCAGLILLAAGVTPVQRSLGLLDIDVVRNAYGRQIDSFVARGEVARGAWDPGLEGTREVAGQMTFIRAPRIVRVGAGVEVLGTHRGEPTLVRQGSVVGAAFHPELESSTELFERTLGAAWGASVDEVAAISAPGSSGSSAP